jgi:hypothetical protein
VWYGLGTGEGGWCDETDAGDLRGNGLGEGVGGAWGAGDLVGTEKGDPGLEMAFVLRAGVNTVVPEGPTRTPPAFEGFVFGIMDAPNMLPPAVLFDVRDCKEVFPTVDPTTGNPEGGTVVPTWRPAAEVARIVPPCPIPIFGFPGWSPVVEIPPEVEREGEDEDAGV